MFNARNVILWLHIIAGFLTMGPLILFDVVMPDAIRKRKTGLVRGIADLAKPLGPMTMLIAVLGIVLVLRNGDDPYDFSTGWIIAALVIYASMVANGMGILSKTVESAAVKLEAGEDASAEASRLQLFGAINILLFLTILWLMVAKPDF